MARKFRKAYKAKRVKGTKRLGMLLKSKKQIVRNRTTVPIGLGFPKKMIITHKYCENIAVTSNAGVLAKYQFSCNGMFDPNQTGTGHQPYYFDQMSALYDHYHVIGSRIKYTIVPYNTNTVPAYVGVYIDDDTTTTNITDISVLAEQSKCRFKTMTLNVNRPVYLNSRWSAKKAFGGSVLGNNSLQGTTTANPTEQQFYTLGIQSFGITTGSFNVAVEVEYIAVWAEIKEVVQS